MNENDKKNRWGGVFEIPCVSKVQRLILDGGRLCGLRKALSDIEISSILDIGCGLGDAVKIFPCQYVGVDNSYSRIEYASHKYPSGDFLLATAENLPFLPKTFEVALLADTSHHLSDDVFLSVLKKMCKVASRYIVVTDPVYFKGQSVLSRFFYGLDRGGCFRSADHMKSIFNRVPECEVVCQRFFTTFPGLYRHEVFILRIKPV